MCKRNKDVQGLSCGFEVYNLYPNVELIRVEIGRETIFSLPILFAF